MTQRDEAARTRCVAWQIAPRLNDEVLDSRIEIALAQRSRINGIEEHHQIRHVHFNDMTHGLCGTHVHPSP